MSDVSTIRLEQCHVEFLTDLFKASLEEYPDAIVYLFGSRVDSMQRGGDLDFLIVSQEAVPHAYELTKKIRIAIKDYLGDQIVDILIAPSSIDEQTIFQRLALLEAIRIWP